MEEKIILPIFPLPELVFFPRTMLPLHIFEPRYQEMIADLLAKPEEERLLVIANMDNQNLPKGTNPFSSIATIGKLVHIENLEDGRSNIVLFGQYTAKVSEIIPSPKSYRMCEIIRVREEYWQNPLSDHTSDQQKLLQSINKFMQRTKSKIKNLQDVSIDDLINGLAFSLNIEGDQKQQLLELQQLDQRLDHLVDIIDKIGYYSEFVPDEDRFEGIN